MQREGGRWGTAKTMKSAITVLAKAVLNTWAVAVLRTMFRGGFQSR